MLDFSIMLGILGFLFIGFVSLVILGSGAYLISGIGLDSEEETVRIK